MENLPHARSFSKAIRSSLRLVDGLSGDQSELPLPIMLYVLHISHSTGDALAFNRREAVIHVYSVDIQLSAIAYVDHQWRSPCGLRCSHGSSHSIMFPWCSETPVSSTRHRRDSQARTDVLLDPNEADYHLSHVPC